MRRGDYYLGHDIMPGESVTGSEKAAILHDLRVLAGGGAEGVDTALRHRFSPDCTWRVSHPINEVEGLEAGLEAIWRPVMAAMPDLERRDQIFIGGSYDGRRYVAAIGHYCGTLYEAFCGVRPTGHPVFLRYGEVYEISPEGMIVQATLLWDILDFIRQADVWPIAPSLGVEEMWCGPLLADGVRLSDADPAQSAASIAQTLAMHDTLMEYPDKNLTREGLMSMPQRQHWHPKMMWYGPAGVGTTRGLNGFVDYHQLPFRVAFERPQGTAEEVMAMRRAKGAGHYIRVGDGPFSVTGGWPSVIARHKGGGFAGMPTTGKDITMRVMDFYFHHEGLIRENWVPIDMLHIFLQMGVDVLGRMRERGV
ncbi:MAG: nuclear transport factor 2 family protein [Pseudomonadota bacterium]